MYTERKTLPAFPFSRATATVAMERKNGNGTLETQHKFWSDQEVLYDYNADLHGIGKRIVYYNIV